MEYSTQEVQYKRNNAGDSSWAILDKNKILILFSENLIFDDNILGKTTKDSRKQTFYQYL